VRAAVAARTPVDAREAAAIPAFLAAYDGLTEPFSETADPIHVTASAIVIGPRGVLLHRHKRLGLWLQPGGHVEPGEDPSVAALRESVEETGLTLEHAHGDPVLVHVDVHEGGRGHTHLDLRYLIVAGDEDPHPPEGESQEIGWFSWDEARLRTDPGLAGALAALQPASLLGVRIREAHVGDSPAVAELYLRSRRHALPGIRGPHSDDAVRGWVAADLLPRDGTWVAEVAGIPVGFITMEAGWVEQFYLDPPWTGRGIGTLLLDQVKALSPGGLQLWTFQANERARAFYLRHGFAEVERTDGARNEEGAPDARLVWPGSVPARPA